MSHFQTQWTRFYFFCYVFRNPRTIWSKQIKSEKRSGKTQLFRYGFLVSSRKVRIGIARIKWGASFQKTIRSLGLLWQTTLPKLTKTSYLNVKRPWSYAMSFLLHVKSSFAWPFKNVKMTFRYRINLKWFFYFFFRVRLPTRSTNLKSYKTFTEKME